MQYIYSFGDWTCGRTEAACLLTPAKNNKNHHETVKERR